ncbi:restriction endonuclease subunit S [Bacillus cereus]|uniref:restriction endonuclease subunit S n=1 Tax=Bacillus cereus TaxID=1396 RepID=UPI0039E65218
MEFSNGINAPKENYGKGRKMISVMDILADEPIVYGNIRNSVQVDDKTESKNKVENGDLVFVRSSEIPDEVGWAKAYRQEEYALYSGFSIRGKKKSDFDAKFIELSLNNSNREQIERKAGGSTRFNVSQSILKSIEILEPSIEEQIEIGNFFERLDETIALHQQELTILKQTKQGFLQKMLPKEGESMPEVRFPGFTEEWEQRKLNEVAEIIGGGTPSTAIQEYWGGDIDWYSPVEIGKETYAFGSQRKITALGLRKSSAKVLPANKTILFTSRAGIGDMAILKKDGATNQGFQSLVVNNNYDIYFVYSMGYKIKEFALKHASGSTFLEISAKGLGKMDLFVPSLEEQIKIGNFFKQLDDTITLHQRELVALKETKKAFLQKMFA